MLQRLCAGPPSRADSCLASGRGDAARTHEVALRRSDGGGGEQMGKALRDGYRAKAFLMTKLDGRTAQSAREPLEHSLRRLQTDRIDLVQIHEVIRDDDPDRSFAKGGCIEALVDARKAGKLRF